MSKSHHDRWLERRLRDVRVPEGLVERLRGSAGWSEEEIEARIREVPDSPSLLENLHDIPMDAAFDQAIRGSQEVRGIATPEGLLSGIRRAVADEQLDEALRDVPLPASLSADLRLPPRTGRSSRLREWSIATSLLLVIGVSYVVAIGKLIEDAIHLPDVVTVLTIDGRTEGISLESLPTSTIVLQPQKSWTSIPEERKENSIHLLALDLPADVMAPPASVELARLYDQNLLLADLFTLRWDIMGYPSSLDEDDLPPLHTVSEARPSGISMPLSRGYDRDFVLRYNTSPIVSPAADESLRQCTVPLHSGIASYQQTMRLLDDNLLPPPREVRVEDFLAAVDYPWREADPGTLSLRTAAGPSLFRENGSSLLLVGVQAGPLAHREHQATDLTIAVDVSSSMQFDGRRQRVQDALRNLVKQLGKEDLLTIVLYAEEAYVAIENAQASDVDSLMKIIDSLPASGGSNVAAGVQVAGAAALRQGDALPRHREWLLLTDGIPRLPPHVEEEIAGMLLDVASNDVKLTFIDLSQRIDSDPTLASLSASTGAALARDDRNNKLRDTLLYALTGRSGLVAFDAAMTIRFNPETVAAYRLLGHEASAAGEMLSASEPVSLTAREAAVALFEVWLRPGDDDTVADIQLTWHDAQSGTSREIWQRVSRIQFATSVAESPLPLQAAAIAAETAEVLRESYFVPRDQRTLEHVLETASQVNPRLYEQGSFQRLLSLMRRVEEARHARP